MRKILSLGIALALLAGCAAVSQRQVGWIPQSKEEMHMLIGQTVLDALQQFHQALLELQRLQGEKPPSMESIPVNAGADKCL